MCGAVKIFDAHGLGNASAYWLVLQRGHVTAEWNDQAKTGLCVGVLVRTVQQRGTTELQRKFVPNVAGCKIKVERCG